MVIGPQAHDVMLFKNLIILIYFFQFIYVNQTFVPAPDQAISNLYNVSIFFAFFICSLSFKAKV